MFLEVAIAETFSEQGGYSIPKPQPQPRLKTAPAVSLFGLVLISPVPSRTILIGPAHRDIAKIVQRSPTKDTRQCGRRRPLVALMRKRSPCIDDRLCNHPYALVPSLNYLLFPFQMCPSRSLFFALAIRAQFKSTARACIFAVFKTRRKTDFEY